MSRVLNSLIALIAVSLANAATLPRDELEAPRPNIKGPTYRYTLKENRNPVLCGHMLHVFNTKFAHMWDAPPIWASEGDPVYSAHSVYAFPMLPHLKHSSESTFIMRYSKVPTSKEFSAIPWKEGRATLGGCPSGDACPPSNTPIPILVAHFDFDDDGTVDTVIKQGFSAGYPGVQHGEGQGGESDYLMVWRAQTLTISDTPSLWTLSHPPDKSLAPLILSGTYLRPFVYAGKIFVASYEVDLGDDDLYRQRQRHSPRREDMFVKRYYFAGKKQDITGWPEWSAITICDFRMKQLSAR